MRGNKLNSKTYTGFWLTIFLLTKIIFYVEISQVSAVVRYTNGKHSCLFQCKFLCKFFSCWLLGEVEVVQHDEIFLLLAVKVDVPAQLGQEQQLAGLKISELSLLVLAVLEGVLFLLLSWLLLVRQGRAVCHLSVWTRSRLKQKPNSFPGNHCGDWTSHTDSDNDRDDRTYHEFLHGECSSSVLYQLLPPRRVGGDDLGGDEKAGGGQQL